MQIPNFLDSQVIEIDGNNKGKLTENWRNILSQLFTQLQINLSDESFVIPQQSTANISQFEGINKTKYTGGIVYDSTLNVFKGSIYDPGTQTNSYKTFTTT